MESNVERELGALLVRVSALEEDIRELTTDVRAVRDTLMQAKGGWRLMMIVAGLSGTVGALITKLAPLFITSR